MPDIKVPDYAVLWSSRSLCKSCYLSAIVDFLFWLLLYLTVCTHSSLLKNVKLQDNDAKITDFLIHC